MNVFVTDGDQRPALAIVRSLARRGLSVIAGDERPATLAAASRYCARHVTYPSAATAPGAFAGWLMDFVASHAIDVVLPVTDVTTRAVCGMAERLRRVTALAVPDLEAFEFVSHKGHLAGWAARCGVPTPPTELVDGPAAVPAILDRVSYPAVVKPARSRYLTPAGWRPAGVHYAATPDELLRLYADVDYLRTEPSLVQRRIDGPGLGLFALFNRGRAIATFGHRRLREKPPSGGVSVLRESVPLDPTLERAAARLLGPLAWHGVAMLEFKQDARTGDVFLIEVNGRFWGSLQLAIDAGVEFPWLVCELALGRPAAAPPAYRAGVRSRWLLGDVDQLLIRLFGRTRDLRLPDSAPNRWQAVRDFLHSGPDLHYEVMSLDDPGPAVHEIRQHAGGLAASAFTRVLGRSRATRPALVGRAARVSTAGPSRV
jgi:predicted ATP-grasp superfamily ATP-dependent carboligase